MKIAETERVSLNSLYQGELKRVAGKVSKTASEELYNADQKNLDAFKDHEEYLSTLQAVLSEDLRDDPSANDYFKD